MNTVFAPFTKTEAETFLWYQVSPRLQLGLAHLGRQKALRYLASVQLSPETDWFPSVNASVGVQGIGTGNPGYSLSFEKGYGTGDWQAVGYVGVGFRSNENHAHPLGGFKVTFDQKLTLGFQHDGHEAHVFLIGQKDRFFGGLYLIKMSRPAWMIGVRF